MSKVASDHHAFFGVRLPFRPISYLIEQIDSTTTNASPNYDLLLRSLLQQPWAEESLFLASPVLHAAWQSANAHHSSEIEPFLANALWRYIFRSYGRSTPYGLFAGMGVGVIGPKNQINFGNQPWQTVSRPDTRILTAVIRSLLQNKAIRPLLRYRLNNSVYEVAGEFHFSEPVEVQFKPRIVLSSLTGTPDLRTLVDYLREHGEVTYAELTNMYGSEFQREVAEYVDGLIDDHFLISNLTVPITGLDVMTSLLNQLNSLPSDLPFRELLLNVHHILASPLLSLSSLSQVQSLLRPLIEQPETATNPGSLVQTDLFFHPAQLVIDSTTVFRISHQFRQLSPILNFKQASPLQDFGERFRQRFDRQEIDLLTALDPEVGIGFTADTLTMYPLLTELPFPPVTDTVHVNDTHERLREILYSRSVLNGRRETEITEADISSAAKVVSDKSVSPSWYLHGELFMPKLSDGDQSGSEKSQEWRFVLNATINASPAFLMGRFCHGHESLRKEVEAMCAWEQSQHPTDILAEIVHLPNSSLRAGNVIARPVLRPFEIPYLTPSGVDADHTILLSDLLVSVKETGEVVLRNKKSGQRVRPRLSSAHNPSLGDEVYQFLCSVQQAEYHTWGWSWGSLSQLPVLPRLVYRNLIVCPAQWTIRKAALVTNHLLTSEYLRTLYGLPRYVQLIEGDNKLLLDLDFEPACKILISEVQKQEKVLLKEWLGEHYQPWLSSSHDQYVSELVIPMKTLIPQNQSAANTWSYAIRPRNDGIDPIVQRSFTPGQEWFYLKIYLHEQVADQILTDILQPIWQQAFKKGWCTKMHFVRYADPDNHLRIRFQTQNLKYAKLLTVWNKALLPYQESGLVKRIQLDTYERELERYHPALIDHCETIFGVDSQFLLNWLAQIDQQPQEDRYGLALLSADALLNDFGFSLAEKVKLSQRLQQAFFQEQGGTKELKRKLNDLYRDHHNVYFAQFSTDVSLISERSLGMELAITSIRSHFSQTPSDANHAQLIASLVHMAMNRIFQGQHRRHELIVYHFLARRYESELAREGP